MLPDRCVLHQVRLGFECDKARLIAGSKGGNVMLRCTRTRGVCERSLVVVEIKRVWGSRPDSRGVAAEKVEESRRESDGDKASEPGNAAPRGRAGIKKEH